MQVGGRPPGGLGHPRVGRQDSSPDSEPALPRPARSGLYFQNGDEGVIQLRYRTAIVVSALAGLGLVAPTSAQAETLTLNASADAYTLKSSATMNFGTATTLRVRDPGVRSYVKFEVSGVPSGASVTAAALRLHSSTGDSCTTAGLGADAYRAASDGWSETSITHSNAPGKSGSRLATADGFAAGSVATFDVTSAVTGNGTVSFYLEMPSCSTDTAVTRFNSREAAGNRPDLVVTFGGDPGPDPQCSDGSDNDLDGLSDFPDDPGCSSSGDDDETDPPTAASKLVVAGGDIACDPNDANFSGANPAFCQFRKTDDLLAGADAVLAVGDTQYNTSTAAKVGAAYDPTWGRFASVTYPALGNHEYRDPAGGAKGYFDYWISKGRPTGGRDKGYYSWELGSWHMIALNTSHKASAGGVPCELGPSCAEGSPPRTTGWNRTWQRCRRLRAFSPTGITRCSIQAPVVVTTITPRSRRCGPTSTRRAQTSSSTVMNTTTSGMSP
jgi:hypothetical protein